MHGQDMNYTMVEVDYSLHPLGFIRSSLKPRDDTPSQGDEGAPAVDIKPIIQDAHYLIRLTHGGNRDVPEYQNPIQL